MALFQTKNLWLSPLTKGAVALYLDVADKKMNVLSRQVLQELEQALDNVRKDDSTKLLVVRSRKETGFMAGADISEFSQVSDHSEAIAISQKGQDLFSKLENLSIPTLAIISGPCLGGGLELALACDYRYAVNSPETQLGMPEVELGLIPGWGGTQRLPRVVGLQKALQIILGSKRLRAAEALSCGLVDQIVEVTNPEVPEFVDNLVKRPKTGLHYQNWQQRLLESNPLGRWFIFRGTKNILKKGVPDDMPAHWEALKAIRVGIEQSFEAGLTQERQSIGFLATTPACKNLVSLFQLQEQAKQLPDPEEDEEPPIRRVGVVGAGTMGAGITQLAALKGCEVVVQEASETALGMGMLQVVSLFEQAVRRGILRLQEMEKRMADVHGSTKWKGFADLDLVIEAIIEDIEAKQKIFATLEKNVSPSTILATNTSSLPVHKLQKGLNHPARVAGLHFFNPVHKMALVEIVKTGATEEKVIKSLQRFVVSLGKTPIVVKDRPGFLVNRILMPYLNEAVSLVGQGIRIELVDRAMKKFGMVVGPLEMLDQVGLDVAAHIVRAMEEVFQDRLTPHPGFEEMKEKDWLGQKSETGFYRWKGKRKRVNIYAENLLQQISQQAGQVTLPAASPEEFMEIARNRMLAVTLNEAVLCLQEEIVPDADTLNLAMILGTGWAPHRGGPLKYLEQTGHQEIVDRMNNLSEIYGDHYRPCEELCRLASA